LIHQNDIDCQTSTHCEQHYQSETCFTEKSMADEVSGEDVRSPARMLQN